jgi:hypothetical protein
LELPPIAEGTNGCAFSKELLNVESEELTEILLEIVSEFTLTSASWTRAARAEVVWVSTTDFWPEGTLGVSFWVGITDEVAVKVACAMDFPGVTPPQALRDALWAAATAAGTNAGADTGSLLFLIAAAHM